MNDKNFYIIKQILHLVLNLSFWRSLWVRFSSFWCSPTSDTSQSGWHWNNTWKLKFFIKISHTNISCNYEKQRKVSYYPLSKTFKQDKVLLPHCYKIVNYSTNTKLEHSWNVTQLTKSTYIFSNILWMWHS